MSSCSVGSALTSPGNETLGVLRSRPACVVCSFSNCAASVWALAKSPLSNALSSALRTDPRSASAGISLSSGLSVPLRLSSAGTIFSSCLDSDITRCMSCLALASFSWFNKSGTTRLACSKSVVTRSRSVDCKTSNGWFFISSSV